MSDLIAENSELRDQRDRLQRELFQTNLCLRTDGNTISSLKERIKVLEGVLAAASADMDPYGEWMDQLAIAIAAADKE